MTTFDDREEAFERKHAHEEELLFRARARRDQKLGHWAAQQIGKRADAATYAEILLALDLRGEGDDALVRRLMEDFAAAGLSRSEHQVRRQMNDFMLEAQREIRST